MGSITYSVSFVTLCAYTLPLCFSLLSTQSYAYIGDALVTRLQNCSLYISTSSTLEIFMASFITVLIALWLYSGYMIVDPYSSVFYIKIIHFAIALITLTSCAGLCMYMTLWEVVGLLSWRLIGHWSDRSTVIRGSTIALASNRYGDMIASTVIAIALSTYVQYIHVHSLSVQVIIVLSVAWKSITILSYVWLPDAMEGPTPVSSLLHSATLVIAGLMIIICKFNFVVPLFIVSILGISVFLILDASMYEVDAKRILAMSTALSMSWLWHAVMYSDTSCFRVNLMHASYKASAFIAVGYLIGTSASQDIRSLSIDSVSHLWIVLMLVYTHYGSSSYALKSSVLSDYSNLATNNLFSSLLYTPLISLWMWSILLPIVYSDANYSEVDLYSLAPAASILPTIIFDVYTSESSYSHSSSYLLPFITIILVFCCRIRPLDHSGISSFILPLSSYAYHHTYMYSLTRLISSSLSLGLNWVTWLLLLVLI